MYSENLQEPLFKQEIQITSNKHNRPIGLDIRLIFDDIPKPLILFIHGFKGFKDWGHFNMIAEHFAQRGFIFAKINLSHNGTTPTHKKEFVDLEAFGRETYTKDLDDITAVLDYFFSEDYLFKRITLLDKLFVIGHSRGGALALLKAAEDSRIRKVVTWASIANTKFLFTPERIAEIEKNGVIYVENARTKQEMPIYREVYEDLLKNWVHYDLEKQVPKIQVPILIIHGKADTSVSVENARKLQSWSKNAEMILLENADHTFGGKEPYTDALLPIHTEEVIDETIKFLQSD
ncbi:alpha/beta hydrolase family protein [Raineya sp.]|jgi:dipeptidyl aminopeptidase/acylaminoacyl peptidase